MMNETVDKQNFTCDLRLFLTLAILASTLWILKFFWDQRDFLRKARAIPCGRTGPFGALGDLLGKSYDECFQRFVRYFQTSPDLFKIWFGHLLIVGVSTPEHMEIVMNNPNSLEKGPFFEYVKPFMGIGLITAPVDVWKKNRKRITKTFNQRILNSFIPMFADKCDALMDVLDGTVNKTDFDLFHEMSKFAMTAVCESSFGFKWDAESSSHYLKLFDEVVDAFMTRLFNVFYYPEIIFNLSSVAKHGYKVLAELNDFSRKLILQRRNEAEENTRDYCDGEDEKSMRPFLDRLLEISRTEDDMTDQQIQDEVNTLIVASLDTTATALSFCCLTMGLHPEYQQKLYEEAMEVLGVDRSPNAEDFSKLKFTDLFIKETIRLFPVAPLLIRFATDDIKMDHLVIPKNTIFLLSILHLHRNPKYWEDPLKFNPYRFLPENLAKMHPYSYLPFSGGPRNCIGPKLAMMLLKLVLTKIVRKFRVTTGYKSVEDVHLNMFITSRPADGFKISFERRQ